MRRISIPEHKPTRAARQRAACMAWAALAAIIVIYLAAMPAVAHAQAGATSAGQSAAEGLRREEERSRKLQAPGQTPPALPAQIAPGAVVLSPGSTGPTDLPLETPCFLVRDIVLTGPDARRFAWLADTAAFAIGQCAGATGLRQIASALDAALIAQGYVTSRVAMPQQNLKDGTLSLAVHAGRVADIGMVMAEHPAMPDERWGTWRNAFPVGSGDILNVQDLEQGVEQMKRLPSQAVATEITPATDANASRIRILRQTGTLAERTRGGVGLDNSGSRILGAAQLSAHLAIDNPLGLNDIFSVSASSNAENPRADHRSQSLSFRYSIPWGYNTLTISRSHSRFAQIVQGETVQFLSHGRSQGTSLRVHRGLLRTSASQFGVYATLATRRANSYLDDVELIVQRHRTTSLETGITWRTLAGSALIDAELAVRRGVPWQNAQEDLAGAGQGGATLRPRITTLSASISTPFTLGAETGQVFQYRAALNAQTTPDSTLAIDQFGIGGRTTVRGPDGDGVLLAENGYVVRNELAMPVALVDGLASVAFVGVDVGRVWGPSAVLLTGDKLAGAALGVRGQHRAMQFEFAVATPLYKPEGFRTRRWNPILSLNLAF